MPHEQPLVASPRARRLIRRRALLLLNLLVTVALLAFGLRYFLPRIGPALWFWAAWIILIAGSTLGTLLRDPGYPFSMLQRLQHRPRR